MGRNWTEICAYGKAVRAKKRYKRGDNEEASNIVARRTASLVR